MARPRLIESEVIVREAYALILQSGPNKLTFESLAARVGLVPAALVKRFKNKQQLIIEIDQYALKRTTVRLAEVLATNASPVQAIIEYFVTELDFATSIDRYANGQEFLLMDLRHKHLYDNYCKSFEQRHSQIVELLLKAETCGELKDLQDRHSVARHLEMIAHGAGHVWSMTQERPIEDYVADNVLFALKCYRV